MTATQSPFVFHTVKPTNNVHQKTRTFHSRTLQICNHLANKETNIFVPPERQQYPPQSRCVNLDEIHISINGAPLSRVDNTKFLGVIIHQNLTWKPHISAVKEKTSKVIGVMCKSRQYLPSNTLKTLYNSLFLPYINYCNIIWASTYDSHLEPLFLLQKKAIRIITFSPPQTHTKPLFHKLNILPIHSIFKCQVACFVFSHMNNLLPASFSSSFHFNFEYHDHFTRSRLNLHKVFAKYHLSICSQAPSIWNSLPLTFRNSLNISNYRSNIKKHFLNN